MSGKIMCADDFERESNCRTRTIAEIVKEMRMGNTGPFKFAYLIGRPDKIVDFKFNDGSTHPMRSKVIEKVSIKDLADRIEAADVQRQKDVCRVIAYLVRDGRMLAMSDERNGKPYKLFGEPLARVYFRLAAQIYRYSGISRKVWMDWLNERDSDPKGMAKAMTAALRGNIIRNCTRFTESEGQDR